MQKIPSHRTPPQEAARLAGLRYSLDTEAGIRREGSGKTFVFRTAQGKRIRNRAILKRIRSLIIPPAWKDVWICSDPKGHLQATGRDARGRKQYRYHPQWRTVRDLTKYHKMIPFGEALPDIRLQVEKDLALSGLPKNKVIATIVRLLEETLIRIGNTEYARENHSYGLTTMHDSHAHIHRSTVAFRFRGKSGKHHDISVVDERIARIVKECRDLPGMQIFQYVDRSGAQHDISSDDVNEYLHTITGEHFTAKDFRTWAGTVHAALTLQEFPPCKNQTEAKRNVVTAIKQVSTKLGNTPAICRKCYVHPFVLHCYFDQSLSTLLGSTKKKTAASGLTYGELAVLALLKNCFRTKA